VPKLEVWPDDVSRIRDNSLR